MSIRYYPATPLSTLPPRKITLCRKDAIYPELKTDEMITVPENEYRHSDVYITRYVSNSLAPKQQEVQ